MTDFIQRSPLEPQYYADKTQALNQPDQVGFGDWLKNIAEISKLAIMGRGGMGAPLSADKLRQQRMDLMMHDKQQTLPALRERLAQMEAAGELKATNPDRVQPNPPMPTPPTSGMSVKPNQGEGLDSFLSRWRGERDDLAAFDFNQMIEMLRKLRSLGGL